jgi:hypothetical protein
MISSYRLGDLLSAILTEDEQKSILKDYPDSVGSKFILEKRKMNGTVPDIDIITNIVLEHTHSCIEFLPKDIEDSTLIHLRLGDVIAGNIWHEKQKRPLDVNYIKSLVSKDTNKKYIIGKCFFASTSSTNYDECIRASNEYLQQVINELNGEHFDSGNADIDLCCAVKSKLFIQGKGHFSKLIVDIRNKLNLPSITTSHINPLSTPPPPPQPLQPKIIHPQPKGIPITKGPPRYKHIRSMSFF